MYLIIIIIIIIGSNSLIQKCARLTTIQQNNVVLWVVGICGRLSIIRIPSTFPTNRSAKSRLVKESRPLYALSVYPLRVHCQNAVT